MPKILICSGCDNNYFPMLREMIYSVKRFPQASEIEFAVLDTGLIDEDRIWLKDNVHHVHAPDWPCEIPAWKIRGREYLKSCVCKPWLRDFFPGYDIYIWIDPDAWVQDWAGVELFIKGAQKGRIALTGQVDRAYPRAVRIKWFWRIPLKLRGFYFSNASKAFGFETAKQLYPYHVLLAGMFALSGDAPHWTHWQSLIKKALKKGKVFTAEQLTLGMMCYLGDQPFEILPAWCHWLCEFEPVWDEDRNLFVEPFLPHQPISVLHVSGFDEMRKNRRLTTALKTLTGKNYEGSLRLPQYDGEKDIEVKA